MKLTHLALLLICAALWIAACQTGSKDDAPNSMTVSLTNTLDFARKDVPVYLDLDKLVSINDGAREIQLNTAFQIVDSDRDGDDDQVMIMVDLEAKEKIELNISGLLSSELQQFPKRTQAEISHKVDGEWKGREYMGGRFVNVDHLKVPPEHTDHSWFIRYEGPGWESDKVGYRFYLDWRNATDIFGKKTSDMVLQDVGQDGFDSYHEPADWGMDVLKVGNSLGLGTIAFWVDGRAERVAETDSSECTILQNGILQSSIGTHYHGWAIHDKKLDLESILSIQAGSRLTHHHVELGGELPNLCTGIAKLDNTELLTSGESDHSEWAYLATYGLQSLAEDNLGMVVFYKNSDLIEITEDEYSHVVVLQANNDDLDYYFAGAWEQEPNGIKSQEEFVQYIDQKLMELNHPVQYQIN